MIPAAHPAVIRWTSAAFRSTPKTRVVAPFNLTLIEGPCVHFPTGAFTQSNSSYEGPDLHDCKSTDSCAWRQDMSFMGNNPGHRDFFFQDLNVYDAPVRPRITHVDDEGFGVLRGMGRHGTLKSIAKTPGHPQSKKKLKNNGTKARLHLSCACCAALSRRG